MTPLLVFLILAGGAVAILVWRRTSTQGPRSIVRWQTAHFVIATVMIGVAVHSFLGHSPAQGATLLAIGAWNAWRGARLPVTLAARWQEEEREHRKAAARATPVARCPACRWVAWNGNAGRCAECGMLLVKVG